MPGLQNERIPVAYGGQQKGKTSKMDSPNKAEATDDQCQKEFSKFSIILELDYNQYNN